MERAVFDRRFHRNGETLIGWCIRKYAIISYGGMFMPKYNTFAVLGGDLRQAHIANQLSRRGKKVYALLLEENSSLNSKLCSCEDPRQILPVCDVAIFPLPISVDEQNVNAPFSKRKSKIEDCLRAIRPHSIVFGGKISGKTHALASENGIAIIDYLEREELAVKNAAITAEGAVAIAMEELPISLCGSNCLVTGHGRIARALMRILSGMGANTTVAARKYGDLAEIEAQGCRAIPITGLKSAVKEADVVFNTVPAQILTKEILSALKQDALVIDLASKPGGVDWEAAGTLGVKTIWALSLPGKSAPISAGDVILNTIGNCLLERGVVL